MKYHVTFLLEFLKLIPGLTHIHLCNLVCAFLYRNDHSLLKGSRFRAF